MSPTSALVGLLIIVLGAVVVYQNPTPYTVSLAMLDITASTGVTCVSAFGFGLLAGVIAMLTRDVPRMRRLRAVDSEE